MVMSLIDAHSHIHEAGFPFSPAETLENAHRNGVDKVIVVGTTVKDSALAVKFAKEHDEVFALIGIHPGEIVDGGAAELEKIINGSSKVVGLGDVGLDYHYGESSNSPTEQKKLLREMLKLAVKYDLTVSFHVRDAFADFWKIFDEFNGKIKGVLHCFGGSKEDLQKAFKRGLFIGVSGVVTFADSLQKIIQKCPLDRVILETDAPWLTPVPFRGKPNQPTYVFEIAKFLAKLYRVDISEVAKVTTANTKRLFGI